MKSQKQTYADLWVHLIWTTKHREPLMNDNIKLPLYDQFRVVSEKQDFGLNFINGVEDHVHLLLNLRPKFSLSEMVKEFKGQTWKWSRDYLDQEEDLIWQDGFSAFSVSPDRVKNVRNYIKNQEHHHAHESFEEELKKLSGQ